MSRSAPEMSNVQPATSMSRQMWATWCSRPQARSAIPSLDEVVPEAAGDLRVLFAVLLHLLGPPRPVRLLTELVLVDPQAIPPRLQGVAPDQGLGEPLALVVVAADVRVGETGEDEGVHHPGVRAEPEDLLESREVEVDDVVADDDLGGSEDSQGLAVPDLLVGGGQDVSVDCVPDHDGVDPGVGVQGVGLDVEDDGVHINLAMFSAIHFATVTVTALPICL